MMCALHSNQQLSNRLRRQFCGFSLSQGHHSPLHKVKLLLKIIKTNSGIDLIPIQDFTIDQSFRIWPILTAFKMAIHLLIIQNIKQFLK